MAPAGYRGTRRGLPFLQHDPGIADANQLAAETDPLAQTVYYGYDENGNRAWKTNARGQTTYYRYDDANQLVEAEHPDGDWGEFAYDLAGNRTRVTSPQMSQYFAYDAANCAEETLDDPLDKCSG